MHHNQPPEKYPMPMRVLHWLMAAMLIGMIVLGWYMSDLPQDNPDRLQIYGLHKSFGVLLMLLVLVRLVVRLTSVLPDSLKGLLTWESVAASVAHRALYVMMIVVPISGYAMSNAFGYDVALFGITLPKMVAANRDIGKMLGEAHEYLAYTLLALVLLHAGAVVKHWLVDKQNILRRML